MDNFVFFIVLCATAMHAVWNGMVKKHPDKVVAVSSIVFGHIPLAIFAIILFFRIYLDNERYQFLLKLFPIVFQVF